MSPPNTYPVSMSISPTQIPTFASFRRWNGMERKFCLTWPWKSGHRSKIIVGTDLKFSGRCKIVQWLVGWPIFFEIFYFYRDTPSSGMSVKLATATATDSASVTDFVQNGHEGAVWPVDSKNQVHFDLGSLPQGQNQGQTKGNALAPKLTVRLRRKWSQTIPRPKF